MPDSVNHELQDKSVKHQIANIRLQNHEANVNSEFVDDEILPSIDKTLVDGLTKIKTRGSKSANSVALNNLLKKVDKQLIKGYRDLLVSMNKELSSISQVETRFQTKMIEGVFPIDIKLNQITIKQSRDIVKKFVFDGRTTKEWYASAASAASRNISQLVKQGIANGETVEEIMTRLRGQKGVSKGLYSTIKRNIEAVARTVTNGVNTQTRESTYNENDDIIRSVIWVSTLDARTTVICATLDGREFPINEGIRPPAHINCRSTTAPIVKSFKELNLPGLKELPPSTRASLNGQVPETLKYPEWLKKQSNKVQEEVLGKEGAQLFREGKVKVSSFTDKNLKPLSLREVKIREGIK